MKYYNGDGTVARDEYDRVGDMTLYASWTETDPSAAGSISVNGTRLTGGESKDGYGWNYDGATGIVRLYSASAVYVVTGKDTAGEFGIQIDAAQCVVTLSNLTINASANVSRPPVEVVAGRNVVLAMAGENSLYGPKDHPAIYVQPGAALKIMDGGGKLTAEGGENAPGIGGKAGDASATGALDIQGGTVVAKGGTNGAGIGAAKGSCFGTAKIGGGTVTATGGNAGAGIGGGAEGTGFSVEISGGTVTATAGGNYSAGIGGGYRGVGGSVKISGGVVTATSNLDGAGIGAGSNNNASLYTGITVEISGGLVTATGVSAPAIGPGNYGGCGAIAISGGTIDARAFGTYPRPIGKSKYSSADSVTVTGGAIYLGKDDIIPVPRNARSEQVFPIDFDIGLPTTKVTSFTMGTYSYGLKDTSTDSSGNLRLWLPSTAGQKATVIIEMSDGSKHYFCFTIDGNGKREDQEYLMVNGEFAVNGVPFSGSGWHCAGDSIVYLDNSPLDVAGV